MWLNMYHTSSNPRVIARYYMEAVTELLRCPQMVRGDMGTENGHIARMQTLLSGEESFLYGASMHNQRKVHLERSALSFGWIPWDH